MSHQLSVVRELVMQFLYQCEIQELHFFSQSHYDNFTKDKNLSTLQLDYLSDLIKGILEFKKDLENIIAKYSKSWKLDRIGIIDRSILLIAIYELQNKKAPKKVVINEAVELAKKFGSLHSGSFVNGIVDAFANSLT